VNYKETKHMAKSVTKTTTKTSVVPAIDMRARMKKDAGRGVSTKAADNLVPLLGVLQPLSPQAMPKNPNYIKGASAGDFLAKNLATPVISGEEGFYFQPVAMYQEWVEWVPRDHGGGFVARHKYNDGAPPNGAKPKPRPEGSRRPQAYTMGKNDLVDTRYIPGYMWTDGVAIPFVIPFTSTGHAVARAWMTKQNYIQLDGEICPAFCAVYKLTTKASKNNLGEWYKIEVDAPIVLFDLATGNPNEEAEEIVGDCQKAYEMGDALNTAFEQETKTAHFEKREEQDDQAM
jgi:hypothetical protein